MSRLTNSALPILTLACSSASISAQVVVPTSFIPEGDGGPFSGFGAPGGHTQVLVESSELPGLLPGSTITGIAFRQDQSLAGSGTTFYNTFNISMGTAATTAETMSSTFLDNFASGIQVKNTPLIQDLSLYPSGGSPNGFGPIIAFDTPFTYTGGDLVVDIQAALAFFVTPIPPPLQADSFSTSAPGYGVTYNEMSIPITFAPAGGPSAAPAFELVFTPEPQGWTLLTALSLSSLPLLRRYHRHHRS